MWADFFPKWLEPRGLQDLLDPITTLTTLSLMRPLVTHVYVIYLILLNFFPKLNPAYCKHGAET